MGAGYLAPGEARKQGPPPKEAGEALSLAMSPLPSTSKVLLSQARLFLE